MKELTAAELRVLELMSRGLSNAAIAARLLVSTKTLDAQIHSILMKLDLLPDPARNRRVDAVCLYLDAAPVTV